MSGEDLAGRALGEGEIDADLLLGREAVLGLDGGFAQAVIGDRRARQVGDEGLVDVVAAEPGIAVGREHLEDAVAQFEDGNIERAAAEIVDGDLRFLAEPLEAVGERGGGGLIDDALDREPGELAGGLGGGALGVVEIGGHGDDGAGDRRLREPPRPAA